MKRMFFLLLSALLVMVLLIPAAAQAKKAPFNDEEVTWEITKAEVVSTGETIETAQGTLIQGFIIEGKAKARKETSTVPEGTIRIEVSAFSPALDLPGQYAGRWYVSGQWTITRNGADPASLKIKHNRDQMGGLMHADLDYNPLVEHRPWTAVTLLPMSTAAGQWSRGTGTYTASTDFNGDLYLALKRWDIAQ